MSPTISIEINMISTNKGDCSAMILFNALQEQQQYLQDRKEQAQEDGDKQAADSFDTELSKVRDMLNEVMAKTVRYAQENYFLAHRQKDAQGLSYDEYLAKQQA